MQKADDIVNPDLVQLDVSPPKNFDELIEMVAGNLYELGRVSDIDLYISDVQYRESLGSTYMGHGIGIPHTKSASVTMPTVFTMRLSEPMTYESCGETGMVDKVFAIAVPEGGEDTHLVILSQLARMLIQPGFSEAFDEVKDPIEMCTLITNHL